MTDEPVTFVSLTVATVTIPPAANTDIDARGGTHLVGVGLLIATRHGDRWRFSREAGTVAAGEKEQNLLLWLSDRLPMADTLIGWQIDQHLVPALIDAAAHADADIAHHFLIRLTRALRNTIVDLSIHPCHSARPQGAGVAATAPGMTPDALLGAWGIGRLDAVRHALMQEALGNWLTFIRQAPPLGRQVEEATRTWMHRHSAMQPVPGKPGGA